MRSPRSLSRSLVVVMFLAVCSPRLRAQQGPGGASFDIKAFGATGDGKTLDHAAINRAIEAANQAGGGIVRVPAGTYRCFSIHLQSRVTIQFEPGATILAADPLVDLGQYDAAEPNAADPYEDFGHSHWHNSLFWGENLENVSIVGPGLIHGDGLSKGYGNAGFTASPIKFANEPAPRPAVAASPGATPPRFGYPSNKDTLFDGVGNKPIALKNCRGGTLRDFSILHGGHFGILATGVDHLAINHLIIDTNRDGMDIDACRDVHVTDCAVNSPWDDGICLKASYGLGMVRDTEDVTISGCYVSGDYQEGTLLDGTRQRFDRKHGPTPTGRIKFGTESSGGFRRIAITNCVFDNCNGLAIESVDGGIIEDVVVSNLIMRGIVASPIFIRLGARLRGPEGTKIGAIRRVIISNVTWSSANERFGSILSGLPGHPLEDVVISNVRGVQDGGGTQEDRSIQPAEKEKDYPEPRMFGTMPSWGLYVRHAVGLTVRDVSLRLEKPDERPCVVLDDVEASRLSDLDVPGLAPGKEAIAFRGVKDVRTRDCTNMPDQTFNVKPNESP